MLQRDRSPLLALVILLAMFINFTQVFRTHFEIINRFLRYTQ